MGAFAERLINAREKKNLTQKQLAEKLGITPTRLNYWEKGKREPNIEMIGKLAEALDVSPDSLMGWEYYDRQNADQIKTIRKNLHFYELLKQAGFAVEENAIKWHWENKDDPSQRVQILDKWEIILSKNGYEATFAENEFDDLQSSTIATVIEVIEGKFFKKFAEQQNKPLPAATENGK